VVISARRPDYSALPSLAGSVSHIFHTAVSPARRKSVTAFGIAKRRGRGRNRLRLEPNLIKLNALP
jgi:hypothetical protein